MTQDIVDRLRDSELMKRWWDQYGYDAADAIEALRKELKAANEVLLGQFKDVKVGDYVRCKGAWGGYVTELNPLYRFVKLDNGWCLHQSDELIEHQPAKIG